MVFAVKAVDKHNEDSAWCHVLVTMPLCFSIMAQAFLPCLKTFRCPSVSENQGLGEEGAGPLHTASYDRTVKKWNAQTGFEVKTLEGHTRSITCKAYAPEEQALFTGSNDSKVKKWNVQTGFEVKTLDGHTDRISCI